MPQSRNPLKFIDPDPIPKTVAAKSYSFLNLLTLTLALLAAFFLFTNGIPLVQWGLLHALKKKDHYENLMRVSLSLFAGVMIFIRWKRPQDFEACRLIRLWRQIQSLPLSWTLGSLFFVYAATMSLNGFFRHEVMATRAFDLGIFSQAVWNTLHDRFLFSSIKGDICLLGDHVSPFLVFLAPAYALWTDPKCLLLLQAVSSASCVLLIGFWAYERTGDKSFAILSGIAFFFFYPSRSALHEDFHPEIMVEPLLLLAFMALEKRKKILCVLALIPALMAKENMTGISFMLGLYAWIWKKEVRFGISLSLISLLLFFFDIRWVVPHFSHGQYFYQANYQHITSDPVPTFIKILCQRDVREYVAKIFFPFLFLPFLHFPTLVLTFPILLQNILSQNPTMLSLNYHYTAGMTPFLFLSTIEAFRQICLKFSSPVFRRWILGLFLFTSLARSGPSEYFFLWKNLSLYSPHQAMIKSKLRTIPDEASVLTHNNFIPQLVNRLHVYQFDYTDTISKSEMAKRHHVDYVIFDENYWESGNLQTTRDELKTLGYQNIFKKDGFYIFKKPSEK